MSTKYILAGLAVVFLLMALFGTSTQASRIARKTWLVIAGVFGGVSVVLFALG